jgi:hypothetical protein
MAAKHRKPMRSWNSGGEEHDPPQICPTAGKRMYVSEAEARATAAHQMSKSSAQLRTYRCLYCDCWHLTSKET